MPFGKYKDFQDCVNKNRDKGDPKAYCATIERAIESMPAEYLNDFLAWFERRADFLVTLLEPVEKNLLTAERAKKILNEGQKALKEDPDAVLIDDHRWLHLWEKTVKRKDKLFISREELRKLHEIYVNEMTDRGMNHKSPMSFSAMKLGDPVIMNLLSNRREFMVDPAFISLIGSSVLGKETSDYDVLFRCSPDEEYRRNFIEISDSKILSKLDLVWDHSGPNGPYMPLYELWAKPVDEVGVMEPKTDINPMSPIPTPMPYTQKNNESIYEIYEDSYYVTPIQGTRIMIHRLENAVMAFDPEMEEFDLPREIKNEILEIKDPKTFILDGFVTGDHVYHMIDMPWWRQSQHIKQPAQIRKNFLKKIPTSNHLKYAKTLYFQNRADTVSYLRAEDGAYYLIPASTPYPIDGSSDWVLYDNNQPKKAMHLQASTDQEIKELVDDGEWENLSADKRFNLMTKRKAIEPLYPYAQMKTTKKGYSQREVFGINSVEDLAKQLFKVPNKQACEVKVDGFRVQVHKKAGKVKIYTESGHEITRNLPGIVADTKRLPANSVVLDAECTPYDQEMTNLGRGAAAPAFAKGATKPVDDTLWAIHVFDILYLDGKDLHELPYEERRNRMRGLEMPIRDTPKDEKSFNPRLWENHIYWATSAEQMIKNAEKAAAVPGSEGAMFKQADSKYRLTGNTPLWSKMKTSYEIDAIVVGVKEDTNRYNYIGAVGPVNGEADKEAPLDSTKGTKTVSYKGKTYSILGKTFNTSIKAELGDIIRVTVKEMNKIDDDVYHWFHPQVLEQREDKTKPDPIETAEEIYKTAQGKQTLDELNPYEAELKDTLRKAFLVSGRYAEESSIACCNTGWFALKQNNQFVYYPNNEQSLGQLKELGVETLIGNKTTRDQLELWRQNNLSFHKTEEVTIRDYYGRKELVERALDDDAYININALKRFYNSIKDESQMQQRLQRDNPYLVYPDEEKTWRYVLQYHARGLSIHADFRAEIDDTRLIGWTWDTGKSLVKAMLLREDESVIKKVTGLTKEELKAIDIGDLSEKIQGRSAGKQLMSEFTKQLQSMEFSKVKELCMETFDMDTMPAIQDPNIKILSQTKEPQPHAWLTEEGEVEPGSAGATSTLKAHYIIVDEGEIEYGAQKSWFHEYFLHGGKMDGRLVVRRLTTREDWNMPQSFAWLSFFTKEDTRPYAISRRAVNQEWYPPKGISAIPRSVREQVPSRYKYWGKDDYRGVRDDLVDALSRRKVTLKLAPGLQFAVKRIWHKGPEVKRGLPIVRYWLIIHDSKKVLDAWDFGRDTDPLEGVDVIAQRRDTRALDKLIATTGELKPDHPASFTKKISSSFDTSDKGAVTIISDSNNLVRMKFNGDSLKGEYVLVKQDGAWIFRKAELPEDKKNMIRMAAQCETGVCSTTGVMNLSTADMKVERVGDLLILDGPAIKPGEVIPMDGRPTYFTKEGIEKFWPSMYRQPIVVLHGDLKGDVVGFVDKIHFDPKTGWGIVDKGVIWHPLGIELVLNGQLPAFSIEVIPETIWDAELQHEKVVGGRCVGLALVPKGACVTCRPTGATMGKIDVQAGQIYKLGMTVESYLAHLYYDLCLSTTEISERENIPRTTIENWLEKKGIPRRTLSEARNLRSVKHRQKIELGGRAFINILGSGEKNPASTMFAIGQECLLINAPKNIPALLSVKGITPNYVLVEGTPDSVEGLHQLRSLNPSVIATASTWKYLRENYAEITGEKGEFEEIYNFDRKILPRTGVEMGPYKVEVFEDSSGIFGYLLNIAGQRIWHGAHSNEVPDKRLKHVDIYIGNGASIKQMKNQIRRLSELEASVIYFSNIGEFGIESEALTRQLHELSPNVGLLYDGAELSLVGQSPSAYHPTNIVEGLLEGDISLIVRNRPYSEYSRQAIMLVDGKQCYGVYVEGMPDGPHKANLIKPLVEQHGLDDDMWAELIGDAENVWTYRPRILKHYENPKGIRETEPSGPYIHNTKLAY